MVAAREGGRLSSIARTAKLIAELLRARELTREDIARLLDVRVAAADRQIGGIGLYLPLCRERRRGRTYVRLDRGLVAGAPKRTSVGTIIAACLGASLAKLFEGTTYEMAMRETVREMVRSSRAPDRFEHVRRQFVFLARGGEKALPEAQGLLDDVLEGLLSRHHLRLRYVGFGGKPRSEVVQPLSLAVYEHQLYVLARDEHGRVHPFRFARIQRVRQLPQAFEYPEKDSYDPELVFADSFGVFVDPKYRLAHLELSLAKGWDHYVRSHRWHRTQQSFRRRGRVHVTMSVRICPEVMAWILGFGADARVVGPSWVREAVAARVAALARVYRR